MQKFFIHASQSFLAFEKLWSTILFLCNAHKSLGTKLKPSLGFWPFGKTFPVWFLEPPTSDIGARIDP